MALDDYSLYVCGDTIDRNSKEAVVKLDSDGEVLWYSTGILG
jgi:hypothetical protein